MAQRKHRPLLLKLTFFSTLLVVFVAGSFSVGILFGQRQAIMKSQRDNRANSVMALRQVAREAILVNDDTDMVNYINLLKRGFTVAYAMVLNPDGSVRVHTNPLLINTRLSDAATRAALNHTDINRPLTQSLTREDGTEIIDLSIPIFLRHDRPEFHGVARIGFNRANIEQEIAVSVRKSMRGIMFAFFIALGVGFAGSFLLAAYITKPIARLKDGSKKIGDGKLDHRIDVKSNDELRDLADEFNLMAEKLGELDEMKRDFVSSVTHELRSPMTSIRGYMDLLLKGAAGDLTATQRDYLSVIKNNTVRLGRFIDNLLDVSKIEAQKLRLTPEVQDIHALVHEMEVLFKPQCDDKRLRLVNRVPADLPPAFVDKDKIAEVLINLTSNAIKFTPEGGEVAVSASEGPNYLEVTVSDTGMGIPPDQIGKLFSKFEQIRAKKGAPQTGQKGTGLGLTIVKGVIEAHGGKIRAESPGPSGRGTAFIFTVPKLTEEIKERLQIA